MEDDVTRSSESLPTSEEFELIGGNNGPTEGDPELHIAGDASEDQLREDLQELLEDIGGKMLDVSPTTLNSPTETKQKESSSMSHNGKDCRLPEAKYTLAAGDGPKCDNLDAIEQKMIMYTTSPSPLDEDLMSISISIADGEYTVFDRITYLGSAVISDPYNEGDVRKNMTVLNEQSAKVLNISLSLPLNSEGYIILYEPSSSNEIASFPISQITAHIPGEPRSPDAGCLALVHRCNQGTIPDSMIFQCHVFRCDIPEAVLKIMQCLSAAVKKVPRLLLPKPESYEPEKSNTESTSIVTYVFDGILEFKEDDTKGGYVSCPKDKDYFKLRCKLVTVVLKSSVNKGIEPNCVKIIEIYLILTKV